MEKKACTMKSYTDYTPEELSELSKDPARFQELVAEANGELAMKQNAQQAEQAIAQNKANAELEVTQERERQVEDLQQHLDAQGYNAKMTGKGLVLNTAPMNPLTGRAYGDTGATVDAG